MDNFLIVIGSIIVGVISTRKLGTAFVIYDFQFAIDYLEKLRKTMDSGTVHRKRGGPLIKIVPNKN